MHRRTPVSIGAAVAALALLTSACGGSSGASSDKIASLDDSAATNAEVTTTTAVSFQDTLLAMTACLREQGLDVDDPTFDANGNPTNGFIIGPDSGLDPGSDDFRTAMDACQTVMEGVRPQGGGPGTRMLDSDQVQESLNEFTECLRDEGLEVDDIDFGPPPGGDGPSTETGDVTVNGSGPRTSVEGGPPPGGPTGGFAVGSVEGGPGGEGFDPTERIIEQLGLDGDDPAVQAAIESCRSILESTFQPQTADSSGTTTTTEA